jgi:hypothetical protein
MIVHGSQKQFPSSTQYFFVAIFEKLHHFDNQMSHMNDLPSKLSPALNLLRDPKDESKFVGLLLVSKVLGSAIPPLPVAPPPSTSPENAAKSTIDSSEFSRKLRVGPNLGDSEDEEDGDSPNREDFDSDVKVTEESEDDDDEDESKSEDAASVPQAPPFDTQILKSIFDAVGFKFLARLIKTTKGMNLMTALLA